MTRVALFTLLFAASLAHAADKVAWRPDYQAARAEAVARRLPLVIVVGSADCPHCQQQDDTTHADPAVVAALNGRAVPVKIAGNASLPFVKALGVTSYPTTIVAAPDGTILDFRGGYSSPEAVLRTLDRHAPPALVAARRAADDLAESAAKSYLALGEALLGAGQRTEAVRAFTRAGAIAPGTPPALAAAGRLAELATGR